jgi:TonB-dependent receptor
LAAIGTLLSTVVAAQTVTGEVTDANNTVVFQGAEVTIEELRRSATTDDRGQFRFSNVPAGEYTLVVSYVGAADKSVPITVTDSGLAIGAIAIGAGGEDLEEVIVYGQAAALAGALSQERSAENLVSVLDTDAMGQFPDQNVAESLRRLSGVSVTSDQGEGRYVMIRGMDPDLNSTSINGLRATAAEPRRALQLDVIPSDVLDGLEVHKTLTADMDADAIGGSINVKTLSAFSRKGAYVKGRVEGAYNEHSEDWGQKLSLAGSNIFELSNGRRLGVAGALSWHDRDLLVGNNELDDWEEGDNGSFFSEEFQPRLYAVGRERTGAVLNLDLDVSDSTRLYAYTLYSRFKDTELRNRVTYAFGDLDEDTLTDTISEFREVEIERDTKGRDMRGQVAENLSIALGSETQRDDWLIETRLGYAYAQERTPDQVSGTWVVEFSEDEGNLPVGNPVLISLDRSNPEIPIVSSDFFSLLNDPDLYELDEIEHMNEKNEDTQSSLSIDFTKETSTGSFKFGAKARYRTKETDEEIALWSGDGPVLSDALLPGGGSSYNLPNSIDPVPDNAIERQILASESGIEFEDLDSEIDSNVADFEYDEDVLSAYAMNTWNMDRATVIAGVRVERTKTSNRGNLVDIIEEDDDEFVEVTPLSASKSYTDVLPSVSLRFDANDRLVARASVYRSVVRPRVEDVAYRVEAEGDEAELGNPQLDPFSAWNVDASIAFYPTELSVVSAGVFYKKIEDFIFVQEIDEYDFFGRTFEATIAQNGEDSTALGFEFNYQQHLGFLSPPFDGLILGFNYTYVDAEADLGDRKVDMPLQAKNIANVVLGYEKSGFDLRLAMKYRDAYVDEFVDEGVDRYFDDHLQWDLTAKYRFSDAWQIYAEVSNLNDQDDYYYAGHRDRAYQYDLLGTTTAIGFQYNFQE